MIKLLMICFISFALLGLLFTIYKNFFDNSDSRGCDWHTIFCLFCFISMMTGILSVAIAVDKEESPIAIKYSAVEEEDYFRAIILEDDKFKIFYKKSFITGEVTAKKIVFRGIWGNKTDIDYEFHTLEPKEVIKEE